MNNQIQEMMNLCNSKGMTPQQLAIQEANRRGININDLLKQAQQMMNGR